MIDINPTQLADIIEDNTGSLINIAELRNSILEERAILIHNDIQIANIRMNKKGEYILIPKKNEK